MKPDKKMTVYAADKQRIEFKRLAAESDKSMSDIVKAAMDLAITSSTFRELILNLRHNPDIDVSEYILEHCQIISKN